MTIAPRNIPISKPSLGEEEWLATKEPLTTGWLTQGPKVAEMEKMFSVRHKVNHALATTSCTTGLHLILAAMGIGPGDEVIVPAFTWISTANVILYCGANPIFADIDLESYNISARSVQKVMTTKAKAIIAVHLFGRCADMDALRAVAGDVPIIEDAACASGASYKGKPAGGLGYAAAFSFHPRKSVTTGEGGMVTTNNHDFSEHMNMLRNHGASISEEQRHKGPKPYLLPEFNLLGFNYRMTDLQAAVGVVQLSKLDKFIQERDQWARFYAENLQSISWLKTPNAPEGYSHGWQSYVCQIDETKSPMPRNDIMALLQNKGVSTRPGTHAIHKLGYYQKRYGFKATDFPNADLADRCSMSIPLYNGMTADDFKYVVQAIQSIG